MPKKIVYSDAARKLLQAGIDEVANTVKVTLGPKGRNVTVNNGYSVKIINDGVTIAKEIQLRDVEKNTGAKLLQEVCSKTNDDVGDGTTSTAVLTQSLVNAGLRHVTAGSNPMILRKGIERASSLALQRLNEIKQDVNGIDQIKNVAAISAGNDVFVGNLIAEAVEKVGKDGIITVEDSKSTETSLEITEGIAFERGYLSPHFVFPQNEKMEVVFDNPYVLLANDNLNLVSDMVPMLEQMAKEGKPLVIIADGVEGETLATLVANNARQVIKVAAVKSPGVGDDKKEQMKDLAALTGATVYTRELGLNLRSDWKNLLGTARQIKVNAKRTIMVGNDDEITKTAISDRMNAIRYQLEDKPDFYTIDKLQQRLAKLAGGVAVVRLGAATETELKDKKLRIEDALNATKAALAEGVVPGGGTTFVRLAQYLENNTPADLNEEEKFGYQSVIAALYEPTKQIANNAGVSGEVILEKVKTMDIYEGYNAATGNFENMIEAGVIDPTKVIRSVIENSASIAAIILTTEVLVTEMPESKKDVIDDYADSLPY